jgi:hypothetical protein
MRLHKKAAKSILWALVLSGEMYKQPEAPERRPWDPDCYAPSQRAAPKLVAASVGASWRSTRLPLLACQSQTHSSLARSVWERVMQCQDGICSSGPRHRKTD